MGIDVLISVCVLLITTVAYFQIVRALGIVDTPNPRSSHQSPTVRGGGIIFPIAFLLFIWFVHWEWKWWALGVSLAAIISFWDDWRETSAKLRLAIYFIAVALLLKEFGIWQQSIFYGFAWLVLFTGVVNAYNFMDGINGITGAYSLVWLISLFILHRQLDAGFPDLFFYIMLVALLIFNLLNFRKRALCFAGDVGAISLALILLFPTFWLINLTGNWIFLLLLTVYGVDSVLTIIFRLTRGENIFQAHRHHIYQNLANEWQWGHLPIALTYSVVQAGINILILIFYSTLTAIQWSFAGLLLLSLSGIYFWLKMRTEAKYGRKSY